MPKLVDKTTGEIVSEEDYSPMGRQAAAAKAAMNPNLEIDYSPGGMSDGAARSVTNYAGDGLTGFNKIGQQIANQPTIVPPMEENLVNPLAGNVSMYKEGGKVKKK